MAEGAIDWWDAHVPGVVRAGTLVVAPPRDVGEIDRFAQRTRGHERADEARIAALEPDLAGRFRKGLFFADEGHLDPRAAMGALADALRRHGADVRFGEDGERLGTGGGTHRRLPGLRGAGRAHAIARRARRDDPCAHARGLPYPRRSGFLHPRIPLYVVPRADGEFMIGATMIESAERGAVSVRSAIEMLSAAYALHPAFGEAEILEMSADVRPAYPDNEPRIEERDGRIFVNGFYRHGFLLAPAFADRAATVAFGRARAFV